MAISVELVGVLVVGTLSLADPAAFPDETVWSAYGRGYYFVPLVLPVLGLLLLRAGRGSEVAAAEVAAAEVAAEVATAGVPAVVGAAGEVGAGSPP